MKLEKLQHPQSNTLSEANITRQRRCPLKFMVYHERGTNMPLTNDEWLERYNTHITKLTGKPDTRPKDEDPLVWLELGFMEDPEGAAEQEVQMRGSEAKPRDNDKEEFEGIKEVHEPTIYERMPMLQGYALREALHSDGPSKALPQSAAYLPDQTLCSDKRR